MEEEDIIETGKLFHSQQQWKRHNHAWILSGTVERTKLIGQKIKGVLEVE